MILQISRDRSRLSIISDGRYFCGRLIRVSINSVQPSVQHTMASANGSVSTGEFSYRLDELKTRLRNGVERVLSLGECQKQLSVALGEMSQLSQVVARWSADVSMLLGEFEKDISCIRDFYQRILSSTKVLVNYGSNAVIPGIIDLLNKSEFSKAKDTIADFLRCLMKLICQVEKDVEKMDNDCPVKIDTVKQQITELIRVSDKPLISEEVERREAEVQASQAKLLKTGMKTMFYCIGGVVSGLVIASRMPEEATELSKIFISAGSTMVSFYTDRTIKTLGEVLDAARLNDEIKKRIKLTVKRVYHCLNLFFTQLNAFQKDIETIKVNINGFRDDVGSLKDESVDGTSTISVQQYVKEVLQKMYDDFHLLKVKVVDENVNLEKEIATALKKLRTDQT